ncbi:hypothetical protein H7F51_09805 [Novosphingobium flavum]|uniref:Lipoprotein n=1 Tax=Novosphingobium flavum TaxID=1778672 RepID=A0A7X1KLY7_9SPHN|nr:hypothetical protein [Novosphingobium flavum]MBC2665818.1 hypothetical protein [Novosphingobium flavum]
MKRGTALPICAAAALALVPALSACDSKAGEDGRRPSSDPIVSAALDEQLMADPDLARINPRHAVVTPGGPPAVPIPPEDSSPEAIAAARAEAVRLVGAAPLHAPQPEPGAPSAAGMTAELTANSALAENGPGRGCARSLDYAFIWAARMPAVLPIYPRGHVQDAAGSDAAPCRLRVVTFRTPVPLGEVVDFYWTRGRRAGLSPRHRLAGEDHVVAGQKGAAAFVAYVRSRDLMTEVDLVTNGL